jgi:hypothetical protein
MAVDTGRTRVPGKSGHRLRNTLPSPNFIRTRRCPSTLTLSSSTWPNLKRRQKKNRIKRRPRLKSRTRQAKNLSTSKSLLQLYPVQSTAHQSPPRRSSLEYVFVSSDAYLTPFSYMYLIGEKTRDWQKEKEEGCISWRVIFRG